MSHGRIFIIADRDSLQEDNHYCPFDEVTMKDWISGCDYVCRQDNLDDFKNDLEWLAKSANTKIKTVTLTVNGEEILTGVFDNEFKNALTNALTKEKQQRLQTVRDEINKENPDMWQIAHTAYNNNCFYFAFTSDMSFENEMGTVDWLNKNEPASWYITEIYDYHT
ncbi:MAG: hypothetical protein J7K84_05225 [Deltaproteobacteria bacterium]|nr:hypothetical protein [Deltaproteobacteria bacterium]